MQNVELKFKQLKKGKFLSFYSDLFTLTDDDENKILTFCNSLASGTLIVQIHQGEFKGKTFLTDRNELANSLLQSFGLEEFTIEKPTSKTQNQES